LLEKPKKQQKKAISLNEKPNLVIMPSPLNLSDFTAVPKGRPIFILFCSHFFFTLTQVYLQRKGLNC